MDEFYGEAFRVATSTETSADNVIIRLNDLEDLGTDQLPASKNNGYELCEADLKIDRGRRDLASLEKVIERFSKKKKWIMGGIGTSSIIHEDKLYIHFASYEKAVELPDIPDIPIIRATLKFQKKSTVSQKTPKRSRRRYIKSPSGHWRYERVST